MISQTKSLKPESEIVDNRNIEQRRERSITLWFLAGAITFAAIVFAVVFLRG